MRFSSGSLRFKAIIGICLVVATTILLLYILLNLTLGRDITRLNTELSETELRRAMVALKAQEHNLLSIAIDYSAWDDTYQFIVDHNQSYIKSNLVDSLFTNYNINLVMIFDHRHNLVLGKAMQSAQQGEVPLPAGISTYLAANPSLLAGARLNEAKVGLVNLSGRLMLLGISPILTSNDEGPSRGTWIFGRDLAEPEIDELGHLANTALQLLPAEEAVKDKCWTALCAKPQGEYSCAVSKKDTLQISTLLLDLTDKPVALARVSVPNRLHEASQRYMQAMLAVLLTVGAIVVITAAWLLSRLLLVPVIALSQQAEEIGSSGEVTRRVQIKGADELETLSRSINTMLDSLQRSSINHQKTEADYHRLVEMAQEGILCTDKQEVITFANPAICRSLGYELNELHGKPLLDLVSPQQWHLITAGTEQRRQGITSSYEINLRAKSGELKDFIVAVGPLYNSAGDYEGAQGVLTDMTDYHRRQLDLAQTQKLESLGVLAGGIAHDFNNILVGIMGNAELLSRSIPKDSDAYPQLQEVLVASQRAADLTRQLLAYTGKGKLEFKLVNINSLLTDLNQLLKAAVSKKVVLNFNMSKDLPFIDGDVTQIRQVAMNLIINAAESMDGNVGTVTITTGVMYADLFYLQHVVTDRLMPAGEYIYLEVADNGTGMDELTLKRIFDPFFTTKFTGRGLGLSAVLGIVRAHQGALMVRSEMGKGTTFRVLFPPGNTQHAAIAEDQPAKPQLEGSGMLIVIDDESIVRTLLKRVLQKAGYKVLCAEDGKQGVELFSSYARDVKLVLLDLTMPRLGGAEVYRAIRALRPDVPVMLMSGFDEHSAAAQIKDMELIGFLEKPFTSSDLLDAVSRALANID